MNTNTSTTGDSRDRESRDRESREHSLTTADLAARSDGKAARSDGKRTNQEDAKLAPLFTQEAANTFRSRWDVVQRGFVDDPLQAVRAGDELVAQVIKSLAESFSDQRSALETELNQADQSSTESLRQALRRYRSFFERLLTI